MGSGTEGQLWGSQEEELTWQIKSGVFRKEVWTTQTYWRAISIR